MQSGEHQPREEREGMQKRSTSLLLLPPSFNTFPVPICFLFILPSYALSLVFSPSLTSYWPQLLSTFPVISPVAPVWELEAINSHKSSPSSGPVWGCLSSSLRAKCLALEGQVQYGAAWHFTSCSVSQRG